MSPAELLEVGLHLHAAWDAAACNVVRRAQCPEGTEFLTRPASRLDPSLRGSAQVATPGSNPDEWLAHPYSFSVLHSHLTHLCRGIEPVYVVPAPGILLCCPQQVGASIAERAAQWSGSAQCLGPIYFRHGFASLR